MSTLLENVAKVEAAHAALKTAIAAKGVAVPECTKLSEMPALVGEIQTMPAETTLTLTVSLDINTSGSIVVPNPLVIDMTKSEDLSVFFKNCSRLTSLALPAGFGQNATNVQNCFYRCTSLTTLTLPNGFGQNATNAQNCFAYCSSLTSLTLPTGFGQNATLIGSCFLYCPSLTSLTLPTGFGQNATNAQNCFRSCTNLTTLTLPTGFGQNVSNSTLLGGFVIGCSNLTDITGNPNFKVSVSLADSKKLTHDSLMVVINGLQTVTTTQTLTLGTANLAKLTDEERKVATDKGWTLA